MRVTAKKTNGVTSTQATNAALARFRRTSIAMPTAAASSTTTRAGVQPTVKSPATRARYFRIENGLPELRAAAADADVEPAREHGVAPPERNGEHRDDHERRHGFAESSCVEHVQTLRREHERAVRVRRDAREDRQPPENPAPPVAPFDRAEKCEVRQRGREQEDRVHAPVDAVEQEHPARHDERGRDERDPSVSDPRDEHGNQGDARDGEQRRDEPQLDEPAAGMRDRPREEEVQRRAAALAEHGPDELADRAAAREERESLVLVRRPDGQPCEEKSRGDCRETRDADSPQRVGRGGECERTRALGRRLRGVAHLGIIRKRPGTLVA